MPKKPGSICVIGELLLEFLPMEPGLGFAENGAMVKSASGSAGIFACAAASLGSPVSMIARVGNDAFSSFTLHALQDYGVDVSHVTYDPDRQIGLSFVEEQAGERHFIYYRKNSAGSTLGVEDISTEHISSFSALHFPATLLNISQTMQQACLEAVRIAKSQGLLISVDPNLRLELADSAKTRMLHDVLSQADVITPNETEALQITGAETIQQALEQLLALGPSVVAITNGAHGVLIGSKTQVYDIPGLPVCAVDTVGAGDVFAAALLTGLLAGMPLLDAGRFANAAAAWKTIRLGAIGRGLPNRDEITDWLRDLV